jgi:hypothetical protein
MDELKNQDIVRKTHASRIPLMDKQRTRRNGQDFCCQVPPYGDVIPTAGVKALPHHPANC